MREVVRVITVVAAEDGGWLATVPWVDDARGTVGQLAVGPDDDVIAVVDEVVMLIHELRWAWVSLPRAPLSPRVWVPPDAASAVDALMHWAAPRGWHVSVLPFGESTG